MCVHLSITTKLTLALLMGSVCSSASSSIVEFGTFPDQPKLPISRKDFRQPKSHDDLPTTSAEIYLANLEGQIRSFQNNVQKDSSGVAQRMKLAELTFLLGLYKGDLHRQQKAIDELTECIKRNNKDAELYVVRARMLKSLHRFKQAQSDIETALELGIRKDRVAVVQQELDWNGGNYQQAIQSIRQQVKVNPGLRSLARVRPPRIRFRQLRTVGTKLSGRRGRVYRYQSLRPRLVECPTRTLPL